MTTSKLSSWNYLWGENWKEYLRRRPLTRDINRMKRDSTREMVAAISDQTRAILLGSSRHYVPSSQHDTVHIKALAKLAQASIEARERDNEQLISAFNFGIDELSSKLDDIADGIAGLNATFQWGFGEVLASLGGIKDSLEELIKTLQKPKTPSKNYSYEKFADARDALERGLYPECLDLLNVAINGDHVSSGYKLEWRFYKLAGTIRLGSYRIDNELIDLAAAERLFLLAARYAKRVDADEYEEEAAVAMLQAGWAAFVQKKLSEARQHMDEAVALDPHLGEAWYNCAKFAMVAKDPTKGLEALSCAIDCDVGYIAKADTDGDFAPYRTELLALYETKRLKYLNEHLTTAKGYLDASKDFTDGKLQVLAPHIAHWRHLVEQAPKWGLIALHGYSHDRRAIMSLFRTLNQAARIEVFPRVSVGENSTWSLPRYGDDECWRSFDVPFDRLNQVRGDNTGAMVEYCLVEFAEPMTCADFRRLVEDSELIPATFNQLVRFWAKLRDRLPEQIPHNFALATGRRWKGIKEDSACLNQHSSEIAKGDATINHANSGTTFLVIRREVSAD